MSKTLPIGEIVHHKSFGDGRIVEVCNQPNHSAIIKVQFFDVPDLKGFIVPNAFITTNNISTESKLVKEWLSSYTAFHCDICNRQKDNIQEIDGDRICSDCKKSLVRCWECGTYKRPNRIGLTTNISYFRRHICNDCLENYYHLCSHCGTMYSLPARQKAFPRIADDIMLCEDCLKEGTITCDCCEQHMFETNSVSIGKHRICSDCHTKRTYICKSCGQNTFNNRHYPFLPGFCIDCGPTVLYERYATEHISRMGAITRLSFHRFKEIETTPLMTRLHKKYHERYSAAKTALSEMHCNSNEFVYKMQLDQVQRFEQDPPYNTLLIDFWNLTLIIVYGLPQQIGNYYDGAITATKFKQTSAYSWTNIHDKRKKTKVVLPDGNTAFLWDKPYQFRAVTDFNKDFGMEYHGPHLVVEKDKYGDTAEFYIIGAIEK